MCLLASVGEELAQSIFRCVGNVATGGGESKDQIRSGSAIVAMGKSLYRWRPVDAAHGEAVVEVDAAIEASESTLAAALGR